MTRSARRVKKVCKELKNTAECDRGRQRTTKSDTERKNRRDINNRHRGGQRAFEQKVSDKKLLRATASNLREEM